jgi:hypothetical protein
VIIGNYAQMLMPAPARRVSAPVTEAPIERPVGVADVSRKTDEAFAAERLAAMGQGVRAAVATTRPRMNPFIGFRTNMAKLKAAGVVSVPVVLNQATSL